jgi:lipopolysaccharide transport system permease protein
MTEHIKELWSYRELIYNLVLRDLKVRYKHSFFGIAWSWLYPLGMMLVFTLVFKFISGRSDMPNYHIFVLSALLPWNFFSAAVSGGTPSIVVNGYLIKKVYFPREVLPIVTVLSSLVNFLLSLPVLFIIGWISGVHFTAWSLLLPVPILLEVLFALGLVFFLSTLQVFYRDISMLMDVMMLAWFFLTPIFYPIKQVPPIVNFFGLVFDPRLWLRRLNPMASIVASYQDLLYYGAPIGFDFFIRTAATVIVFLIAGYWFFHRFSGRFGEEV